VLSAIVEIKVPVERTEEVIRLVWEIEKQIDTVVALGSAAAGGVTLFGKNSDRPPGEPQAPILLERAPVLPAGTVNLWAKEMVLPDGPAEAVRLERQFRA